MKVNDDKQQADIAGVKRYAPSGVYPARKTYYCQAELGKLWGTVVGMNARDQSTNALCFLV